MELDSSCLLDADGAADPGETDTQSLALLSSPFCVSWVRSMGLMAVGDEAGVYGGILLLIGVVTGGNRAPLFIESISSVLQRPGSKSCWCFGDIFFSHWDFEGVEKTSNPKTGMKK